MRKTGQSAIFSQIHPIKHKKCFSDRPDTVWSTYRVGEHILLYKKRKLMVISVIVLIFLIFFPFFGLFTPKKVQSYVYRTYVFTVIAEKVSENSDNQQIVMESIFDFIYCNVFPRMGEKPIYATDLYTLVRGIGWCDQQSTLLATLSSFREIYASMMFLKTDHTVSTVEIEDQWRIVDPLNGVIFKDEDGEIASYHDLHKKNEGFSSRILGELYGEKARKYLEYFQYDEPLRDFYPPLMFLDVWKRGFRKLVAFYHGLFGRHYFYLFQDFYLTVPRKLAWETFDLRKPDERLYYKARNYQICWRFEKAHKTYRKLIAEYPESMYRDRSYVFEASSLMKQGKWIEACRALELFLEQNKNSKWVSVARYYLCWCKYHMGEGSLPEEAADVDDSAIYFR